ncbi:MAG: hypothetical protein IT460_16100 [Planctomycetes bacterium]|nr:hypothetical protein [Planctomycetota bacterium]
MSRPFAVGLAVALLALAACGERDPAAPPPAAAPATSGGPAARPAPPAPGAAGAQDCASCHERLHPSLQAAHRAGPHRGLRCEDCHGADHDRIFSTDGQVSSATCGRCHEKAYAGFRRSRHGRLLKEGKADAALRAHPAPVGSCNAVNGCHAVQRENADGSVGACAACHAAHAAAPHVARDPAVCARCHRGPDHLQWETWAADKHGVLWRQQPGAGVAPACADCHLPGGDHDDGRGLTRSVVARHGAPPTTLLEPLSRAEHDAARAAMVAVCTACHGKRLAEATLASADDARADALALCEEAAEIVRGLDADGLLSPRPKDRTDNPVAGGALVLGGKQIFDETSSRAERLFYELWMFDFPGLWRAAYHTDPDLVRWTARERLKTHLIELRAEAARLRAAAPPPK